MSATIMKILRDGQQVGMVDLPTGRLTSSDTELAALYQRWERDGFKVLGPGPVEPPPGVLADALYTIRPGPDNMGLVAIELGNHGYELKFWGEDDPPSTPQTSPARSRAMPRQGREEGKMSSTGNARVYFGLPRDRSLEAYKDWIMEIIHQLGGSDNMTEEQWVEAWKEFWAEG